jgi:lysophospholipase L1-like esterase
MVKQKWPNVQVDSCAVNGARVDDFFNGDNQIGKCFPAPEQKKTLVIITMGGNDIADMAKKKKTVAEASVQTTQALADMKKAVDWLKDPVNFPNGSYVVFANVYEYTDLFADLSSCPTGGLAGFSGEWLAGTSILVQIREGYMSIAKESGADMLFLGETFCGHGYKAGDATGQCYRGPGAANWFDISCIHPTPEGHTQIAKMFMDIINE